MTEKAKRNFHLLLINKNMSLIKSFITLTNSIVKLFLFHFRVTNSKLKNIYFLFRLLTQLFFCFWVSNLRLNNKKFQLELLTRLTRWVHFYFLTFELRKWSWYMKKKSLNVTQFEYLWTLRNRYYSLDFYEPPITVCIGVDQPCSKVGVACILSPTDGNLLNLLVTATGFEPTTT